MTKKPSLAERETNDPCFKKVKSSNLHKKIMDKLHFKLHGHDWLFFKLLLIVYKLH